LVRTGEDISGALYDDPADLFDIIVNNAQECDVVHACASKDHVTISPDLIRDALAKLCERYFGLGDRATRAKDDRKETEPDTSARLHSTTTTLTDLISVLRHIYGDSRWPLVAAVVARPSLMRRRAYSDAVAHFISYVEWEVDKSTFKELEKTSDCSAQESRRSSTLEYLKSLVLGLRPQHLRSCELNVLREEFRQYALAALVSWELTEDTTSRCAIAILSDVKASASLLTEQPVCELPKVVHPESIATLFLKFVHGLPKSELHAHISGSIRTSTLVELSRNHFDDFDDKLRQCCVRASHAEKRDLNECFQLFKILHHVIDSLDILKRVTYEVLVDFVVRDRVAYIELRTTPRSFNETLDPIAGKQEYMRAVCEAFDLFKKDVVWCNALNRCSGAGESKEHQQLRDPISWLPSESRLNVPAPHFLDAKLLISIDRSHPPAKAIETVAAVQKLRNECLIARGIVAGLDFSGNPFVRGFAEFTEAFQRARQGHLYEGSTLIQTEPLPITIHFAETADINDANAILDFKPERVGHAAVMNEATMQRLKDSQIPVEICLSSNFACKLHKNLVTHPFRSLLESDHSLSLCTDDKGIFLASLLREYLHLIDSEDVIRIASDQPIAEALSAFKADIGRLRKMLLKNVNSWFTDDETKARGYSLIQRYVDGFIQILDNM